MFTHIVVGSNDLAKSKQFYDAIFKELGIGPGMDMGTRLAYMSAEGNFMVTTPINGEPACHANGGTIGFKVSSPEQAKAWHDAGVANGGTSCEDPPGLRELPFGKLYLAYLRDPDGNKLCTLYKAG